ncbi:MAG: gliding motility-associated C-terminal domain-containing protein [Bacteroidales bacterium]|nr:gliding motility-associated C-terminal domain-containing protein [Bacteroidales bacterium]
MKTFFIIILTFIILLFPVVIYGQGDNFYWIGGTGNWSDTLHWSSETGGIPSQINNVIFDANSFTAQNQKIIIDIEAECRNMDWSNANNEPAMDGSENLNIYGSFILSSDMTVNFSGDIIFNTSINGQAIRTEGNILNSNLYFNGTGQWNLLDSLDIGNHNLYFNSGALNTMGNTISCGSFYSNSNNIKVLKLNSSIINIRSYNGEWIVNNQLLLLKGNSVIKFSHSNFLSKNAFTGGDLNYNNVVFFNDAVIEGNNSFINLYFNANHKYELESGKTQNIKGNLYARGCAGLIDIWSTDNSQTNIVKTNGNINVSFVALKCINAILTNGEQFNAYNSIDMGNNQGCNIYPDSRDMYWINGTGNWTDTIHWTSNPVGPDADCVPIRYDNVFFDNNSFNGPSDTVNVNVLNASCNDMAWTTFDNPVFKNTQADSKLNIHGSLQFSNSMINEFSGEVFFRDSLTGQTIQMAGKSFHNNVYFTGNGGGWTLLDSINMEGNLLFYSGSLNTNNNFVGCNTFHSDTIALRSLNLGSSQITVNSTSPYPAWSLNDSNLVFNAGTSHIELIQNGSTMYNYGGDTIEYHNVSFSGAYGIARLDTEDDTYSKFHKVVLGSNARVYGNNSYDTLSFSPGCFYEFPSGRTQTIEYNITPSGICEGPILLQSTTNGLQALIKTNDTLEIEYTSIKDINATGEAVYIANNSVDLGNNNGWDTISISAPGKLFWVGDEGNWNDPMHWDTISGGAGGHCIPTPYDTVIFDDNSFFTDAQKVTVNLNNAFAHNLDWSQANYLPEFSGLSSGYYLRIYGSLELNPEINFTFPGYIYFGATNPGQTIITSGIKFHNVNNNVYFDGIGGEWTLIDSLDLGLSTANQNSINFYNGNLITGGKAVTCFNFYSTVSNERTLSLDSSEVHIANDWYVYGTNLILNENTSLVKIDSGEFIHYYGNYFPYNDVFLTSSDDYQKVQTISADSVFFKNVIFNYNGEMSGSNSSVFADSILFSGIGKINLGNAASANVYDIDSLLFTSAGYIYGNDTVGFLRFDSTGLINGNGEYEDALFLGDGEIFGNNQFDTLTFSPGYTYQLEGEATQTIINQFNITGNNCESIWLQSTSGLLAEVHKDTGFVFGDFIEMTNISATGEAVFDAGYFSTNINNSNEGWIFYDFPFKYNLGNDTTILEGDTLYLCASNFNGNAGTSYVWHNCTTGDILGYDSCLIITENGEYCIEVLYDDGPGCVKYDTILVGCYLDLAFINTDISCNGFEDGSIEMLIEVGTEPFEIYWTKDGDTISTSQNIYNIAAGTYVVSIEDAKGCISEDSTELFQPDTLKMTYEATDACFEDSNGTINLNITGGTEPYHVLLPNYPDTAFFTGLFPGQYFVTVTDDHDCPSINENIIISELPELVFELDGTDLICYNDSSGTITIFNLTGGTGNYTDYSWFKDNTLFVNAQNLENVQAGDYTLTITDDYGCFSSKGITINEPDELTLNLKGINGTIGLGSIDLTVSGGINPYNYLWSTEATTEDIGPLGGGEYSVIVTDEHGCEALSSIFVEVRFRVLAPTAFSPNGDGINDYFRVRGLGTDLHTFDLTIFDRWGAIVFETNDFDTFWNGKRNNTGEDLPVEVYTWLISLTYSTGERITDKGNVTLLR